MVPLKCTRTDHACDKSFFQLCASSQFALCRIMLRVPLREASYPLMHACMGGWSTLSYPLHGTAELTALVSTSCLLRYHEALQAVWLLSQCHMGT